MSQILIINIYIHGAQKHETNKYEKTLGGDANTAHWLYGGAKDVLPVADSLPRGAGLPKFNQLEMVTTFTYKPSLVRIDARNCKLS